ncbi:hypothetical protein Trydic_g2647 [Trypoxylus dichotomus]
MPICSDYCGTCTEQCKRDTVESSEVTSNSELFFFVTDTVEVVRNILYYKILPLFVYQRPKPRDPSYMDSVWSLFGFHVESEPPHDEELVFCNGSIFALIFVLYFGYLFMATKCVNAPKYQEEDPRFIPYLMPAEEDEFDISEKQICCHHQQDLDERAGDNAIEDGNDEIDASYQEMGSTVAALVPYQEMNELRE